MNYEDILEKVDHTLLKPTATWDGIQTVCDEAIKYKTASVCIPPSFVKRVSDTYGKSLVICTVIGFPLGYNDTETKVFEAKKAVEHGAEEIDMVINLGFVKEGRFDLVTEEIKALKKAVGSHVLKVIVETCYLTEEEKAAVCRCVSDAGADFIKTSTGFGTAGASVADIELFKAHIKPGVKIKAAGGIRTKEQFVAFAEAGCDRIGASAAVTALVEAE